MVSVVSSLYEHVEWMKTNPPPSQPPFNSTNILIIDPVTETATRSTLGVTLTDSGKWLGGVLAPNGTMYGVPANATDILRITTGVDVDSKITLTPYFNKF